MNHSIIKWDWIGLNDFSWCIRQTIVIKLNQCQPFTSLFVITSHFWQKKKKHIEYRKYAITKRPKKMLFLEIQSDYYLCKESRLVLFEKTRQIWLMGCHKYTYYSLFGIVDRVTCDRWARWAHDSLCTVVLSQTSLPRPVKAPEPSGIRTGDMRANRAAGSQRV